MAQINGLEGKIPSKNGFIDTSLYNADKQNIEKNIEDVDKKYLVLQVLSKKTDQDAKITETKNKLTSTKSYVNKTDYDTILQTKKLIIKLRNINNEIVSNKIKPVKTENKLDRYLLA